MALESGIAQLVETFIAADALLRASKILMTGEQATLPARYWQEKLKPAYRLKILNSMQ